MSAYPKRSSRKLQCLDGVWDFAFVENHAPDEISQERLSFAHKMAVPGAFDVAPDFYGKRGTALYRRYVEVENDSTIRISFDGLGLYGLILWDGCVVSECRIPYSTFSVELAAKPGIHELRTIIFNGLNRHDLTPLFRGIDDYYGFGGIYRSVFLEELPTRFIERVKITTQNLEKRTVKLEIVGGGEMPDGGRCITVKFDNGETKPLLVDFKNGIAKLELAVPNGKLWTPESPNLHTVTLSMEGDVIVERFGIRKISTQGKNILLNGKKLYLKGFNRHESHPQFGPVQTVQLMLDDIKRMKEAGANYVRCVHYQQNPEFFDLCDELGLLCWEETIGFGLEAGRFGEDIATLVAESVKRMIRRNFNNPSIIFWSFLNEARNNLPECEELYETVVGRIRSEDPSRLVSYCCWGNMIERCRELCDVISFHVYPGWICCEPDNFDRASSFFDSAIAECLENGLTSPASCDKPFIFSEMGTCAIYGFHDADEAPWSEEFQADYDTAAVRAVLKSSRVSGFTIWQFFDSKSFTRGPHIRAKARGFNNAGVLDEYRRPKLAYGELRKMLRQINAYPD